MESYVGRPLDTFILGSSLSFAEKPLKDNPKISKKCPSASKMSFRPMDSVNS